MASNAVDAARNAVNRPRNADLSRNPFQSLQSGYNVAIYIVKEVLGLDPIIVVNLSIFLAAASTVGRYFTGYLYSYLKSTYISSVRIHEDDSLYTYVMKWMTDHHLHTKRFRSVKAKLVQKTTIEDEEEAFKLISKGQHSVRLAGEAGQEGNHLISYRTMMGRNPIQFQPYQMSHIFLHKRNVFLFKHALRSTPQPRGLSMRLTGELTIECLGRSLDPVKSLLEEAQTYFLEKSMSSTAIFRANGPGWARITSRPSRDIDTVILEKTKKQMLLQDVNEYLHPQTRRWYANHGIPYRRGYLFSGPPGTGKTSLTAALAGVFGLDIYVLTLVDPYLTEEILVRLFSSVPSRCIVLLEDIDAAGLKRADELKLKKVIGDESAEDKVQSGLRKKPTASVSLSGLLNAIDGVASSEGRILIMTTNKPKELDQALIRPGRVDLHIQFTLPQRPEIVEMFESMYRGAEMSDTLPVGHGLRALVGQQPGSDDGNPVEKDKFEVINSHPITKEELVRLAGEFADQLPENKLSLSAIQGFLLRFKHDPRAAIANAKQWSDESLKTMEELDR
ncbi:uncharacterized protein PV09_06470 [Verruconis gallopava]|uniref:AAA+ ATPase domain-containing protein n=1 Tax=Verruconis gallopava TaxID=253628 RepID=A0A0D2A6V8_9PEZI|nr:uncharacterized protein PV09_06470 [Verruconis gallopava]KIW02325.1 hypothetical protein PV09_06470 [Verruconis gallopava]